MYPTSKSIKLDDQFSLIEPSVGAYRACIKSIIAMSNGNDEAKVDSALYEVAMVLLCLHCNNVSVIQHLTQKDSVAEAFNSLESPEAFFSDYANKCPARFLDNAKKQVDSELIPFTKKAETEVKN